MPEFDEEGRPIYRSESEFIIAWFQGIPQQFFSMAEQVIPLRSVLQSKTAAGLKFGGKGLDEWLPPIVYPTQFRRDGETPSIPFGGDLPSTFLSVAEMNLLYDILTIRPRDAAERFRLVWERKDAALLLEGELPVQDPSLRVWVLPMWRADP